MFKYKQLISMEQKNENMKYIYILLVVIFGGLQCDNTQMQYNTYTLPMNFRKIRGLSFVAPPNKFTNNPMNDIKTVAADWISVIPYAYTRKNGNVVRYNESDWQWWGERPEGVHKSIELAKAANIKVMLKPQVYVPGSWTGDLSFDSKQDWKTWSTSYENYILPFAEMADSLDVELFCIGTEFKKTVQKREQFWRDLISKIKEKYKGKLTYAANWDEYQSVPFWDELDFVGVNAYFPLINDKTPTVKDLLKAWQPEAQNLQSFAAKTQRPILFTEFGYLSVDGCAYNTWELEAKVKQLPINETAQANALDALFTQFWNESYWAGGFIWKWFPNGEGHEGYIDRDYTPQGKVAETILKKWYGLP